MTSLLNILLISNVFLSGFLIFFETPFEFYVGYCFIIYFIFYYLFRYRNLSINYTFLIVLLILSFLSVVNVVAGHNDLILFIKQFIGISVTGISYYLLIEMNDYDVNRMYSVYTRMAFIVAFIGLLQQFVYLTAPDIIYSLNDPDISPFIRKGHSTITDGLGLLRINSILMEPSHFAAAIAPATCTSIIYLLSGEKWFVTKSMAVTLILATLLSFSLVGYLGIILGVIYSLKFRTKYKYLPVIVLLPTILVSIFLIPDFQTRIHNSFDFATGGMNLRNTNHSTYTMVSNAFIALEVFKSNPLYGNGLGSHPKSYDNMKSRFNWYNPDYLDMNKADAGSLILRLISETGVIGLFIVFYFIIKFHLKGTTSMTNDKQLVIINNSVFCLFILSLVRQGHYFYNGLFFFVWLYYFSYLLQSDESRCFLFNGGRAVLKHLRRDKDRPAASPPIESFQG